MEHFSRIHIKSQLHIRHAAILCPKFENALFVSAWSMRICPPPEKLSIVRVVVSSEARWSKYVAQQPWTQPR